MDQFTQWLNRKRTVILLMMTAFVIRGGLAVIIGERYLPMADQIVFVELAKNIASGKGMMITDRLILPFLDQPLEIQQRYYTMPERIRDLRMFALWGVIRPDTPTAFIEPMVPLIYAGIYKLFGASIVAPRLLQALLDALVVGMLFSLAAIAFPRSRAPGIAALIYTFYPFSIMFSCGLITQPIYLFLQCLLIYVFYKFMLKPGWGYALLLGLVLGLITLTRISIIAFAPFLFLALYLQDYHRPRWLPAAAAIILGALLIIPWAVRNKNALGEYILLPTKGGRNLWEYNNQLFTREKREAPPDKYKGIDALYYRFAGENFPRIQGKEYLEFPEFTDESELERDRELNYRFQQFMRLNPGIYLKLCFYRFYQFFRITPSNYRHIFFQAASYLSYGWILPFSVFGLIILLKKYWRRIAPIVLLVFYNSGIHTLTASGIPHRMPIDPYLILFAAFALHWLLVKFEFIILKEEK